MGLHFRENLGSLPCPTFPKAQRVSLGGRCPYCKVYVTSGYLVIN